MNHNRFNYLAVAVLMAVFFVGGFLSKNLITGRTAAQTASERFGLLQAYAHSGPPSNRASVPFLGPFRVGNCGPGVRAMEQALKRKHIRKSKARNCFGPATKKDVIAWQRKIHYKPSGVYNKATHVRLVKSNGYTAQARRDLYAYAHRSRFVTKQRYTVRVVAAHANLVGGNLPYTQSGSRSYFAPWPSLPPNTDCSGFVTWIAYQAGFGAAVGYYGPGSAVGWTGTLSYQGSPVPRNQPLEVGDLVFYPSDNAPFKPWGHVAMYIGHNDVISHGHTGVDILPYNYRAVGEVRRYIQ